MQTKPDTDTVVTRACPYCAEIISSRAKVCPRCRQWLTLRSLGNPMVGVFLAMLTWLAMLFAAVTVVIRTVNPLSSPPPYYTDFPGSLQVLESRMHWTENTLGPSIYVTGIVTNRSTNAWRSLEFECRFFDGTGVLVDAANARGALTVNPRSDSAFRVTVTPGTSSNHYRTCAISVSTARNTKSN